MRDHDGCWRVTSENMHRTGFFDSRSLLREDKHSMKSFTIPGSSVVCVEDVMFAIYDLIWPNLKISLHRLGALRCDEDNSVLIALTISNANYQIFYIYIFIFQGAKL